MIKDLQVARAAFTDSQEVSDTEGEDGSQLEQNLLASLIEPSGESTQNLVTLLGARSSGIQVTFVAQGADSLDSRNEKTCCKTDYRSTG